MKAYLEFLGKLLLFLKGQLIGFDRPFRDEQTADRFHAKFVDFLRAFVGAQKEQHPKFLRMLIASPASKGHHQNYEGGLMEHCYLFAAYLYSRTNEGGYNGTVPLSLSVIDCFEIALFHDFCKVGLYKKTADGYEYNPAVVKHHAKLSIEYAEKLGYMISPKVKTCIALHMSSWWNKEDENLLDDDDRVWASNHLADIAAVQWADMKAC